MPRIRTIKPEFFTSETVGGWSDSTQVIFMGLLILASNNGIGSANPRYLVGQLRAYQDPEEALMKLHEAISELQASGTVSLFRRSDRDFYWIRNWDKHQYVQHPGKELHALPTEAEIQAYKDHHSLATSENVGPSLTLMKPHEGLMKVHSGTGNREQGTGNRDNYVRPAPRAGVDQIALYPSAVAQAVVEPEPEIESGRPDVEALCARLHGKLVENDYKPTPRVTKGWRDQARYLLDKDERNLDQALRLITWALENDFWSTNIASMGKFRQQYPKLLAAAQREHAAQKRTAPPTVRSQRLEATAAMVARLRAEEAAEASGTAISNFAWKALEG